MASKRSGIDAREIAVDRLRRRLRLWDR